MPGDWLTTLEFARPQWLWLLLGVPVLALLRETSRAGLPPWRTFGSWLLRCAALTALALALAEPFTEERRPDRSVAFVLDASASLSEARRGQARRWLDAAEAARGAVDARWVVAGSRLRVFASLEAAWAGLELAPPSAGTDLRSALELGLASLPAASRRDVVLLSDGAATRGRVDQTARVASTRDLPVHTVPLGEPTLQAAVVELSAVQDRRIGEEVGFTAALVANSGVTGELVLEVDGRRADTARVDLAGSTSATLSWLASEPGLHEALVRLSVPGDPTSDDDVARARFRVLPQPSALVVGPADAAKALQDAIAAHRPQLTVRRSSTLTDPGEHTAIALLDPDLPSVGEGKLRSLVDWVRGGGRLLVTGGPNGLVTDEPSAKPLADVLPVRFPETKKEEPAPLSVVYCLDTSDSMAGGAKFELAGAALAQSLGLLPERARVGILGFSDSPFWISQLADFAGTDPLLNDLRQVQIRGGTSIFGALGSAYAALKDDQAMVKHVVLLSDGQSTTTFARNGDILTALLRRSITVTTIAVSRDSDRTEMQRIAEAGGGRAHYAERFTDLPQLFLEEMMQVTRTNKVEQDFPVQPVLGSRMLGKLHSPTVPNLHGYVRGEQRAGTELALATDDGHPVLVMGRHGRGAITLLTTDVGGAWSARWRDWPEHRQLWDGVLDVLLRPTPPRELSLQTTVRGDRAELVFDAVDPLRNPRGDLLVEAIAEGPDGQRRFALPPVGPGRYGASLQLAPGATLLRVAAVGTTGSQAPLPPGGELLASVQPQPAEETLAGSTNHALLKRISRLTRGQHAPDPTELFTPGGAELPHRVPRHMPLLALCFGLFLTDLLWRRLRTPPSR